MHRKCIPIYIQQDATLHSLCAPDDWWRYHPKRCRAVSRYK